MPKTRQWLKGRGTPIQSRFAWKFQTYFSRQCPTLTRNRSRFLTYECGVASFSISVRPGSVKRVPSSVEVVIRHADDEEEFRMGFFSCHSASAARSVSGSSDHAQHDITAPYLHHTSLSTRHCASLEAYASARAFRSFSLCSLIY